MANWRNVGANIYIPQALTLREILKFVLSILGLTWQNLRTKLVREVGETAVIALETGFDLIRTLITQGPAAAWEQMLEAIGNLRQMAIDAIMDFVKSRVVEAAVTRLLSMLNPAGAFIQAILAIYNTVMFFVERIRQIAQVAAAFIDGIAAIAAGNIGPAANKVETTMAGLLTLVISFLARIAGLGRVADAVTGLINRIRAPIDRAMDRVVRWIVTRARALGRMVVQAGVPSDPNARLRLATRDAIAIARAFRGPLSQGALLTAIAIVRTRYSLNGLEVFQRDGGWWVRASINPRNEAQLISPTRLGALIEPILARIEGEWFAELNANMGANEQRQDRAARASIRRGGRRGHVRLGSAVSPESEIQIHRDMASGALPVGEDPNRTMRAPVRISGGAYETGGAYVNDPRNMGRSFITGAGDYEESIPAHVNATRAERLARVRQLRAQIGAPPTGPLTEAQKRQLRGLVESGTLTSLSNTRRRLTETLETARSPGMLVTRRVTEELVATGGASAAEATHGNFNPMAFVGAAGENMNEAPNRNERHRRLGLVFRRLSSEANSETMAAVPGGPQLQALSTAVDRWLAANRRSLTSSRSTAQLERATQTLINAFIAFLRQQRQRR